MITTKKATNNLLEIIQTLPKDKYNQLYDFAMFLTLKTANAKKTYTYFSNIKEPIDEKKDLTENELSINDIKECFGLWKDQNITKESLREKSWRNAK